MAAGTKSGWLIPVGLLVLCILPLIGGTSRLMQLISGAEITAGNARFFAAPAPVVIHILSSAVYVVLGAFQFSPSLRRRKPSYHRTAGQILIPIGLICALSGMWMAWFYPPLLGDGTAIRLVRLVVATAMASFICLGFAAIKHQDIRQHRAWMIRAYALAIAAGTQPLTLAPIVLFPGLYGELGFTLGLTAGWIINLAFAEWLIRRGQTSPSFLYSRKLGDLIVDERTPDSRIAREKLK
jgi:uncharacterized membrane protein